MSTTKGPGDGARPPPTHSFIPRIGLTYFRCRAPIVGSDSLVPVVEQLLEGDAESERINV